MIAKLLNDITLPFRLLWWHWFGEKKEISDRPHTIRANNITVARGYKCKHCGVVRPFNQPECSCDE